MDAQAIIYVVDSTDTERIGISREEFHAILEEEELKDSLILVYANKQVRGDPAGPVCVCACVLFVYANKQVSGACCAMVCVCVCVLPRVQQVAAASLTLSQDSVLWGHTNAHHTTCRQSVRERPILTTLTLHMCALGAYQVAQPCVCVCVCVCVFTGSPRCSE